MKTLAWGHRHLFFVRVNTLHQMTHLHVDFTTPSGLQCTSVIEKTSREEHKIGKQGKKIGHSIPLYRLY